MTVSTSSGPNRARRRAERCFALARSTTFEAERDTAVQRRKAIAEEAGLDLAMFDIPGQARPAWVGFDPAAGSGLKSGSFATGGQYTSQELREVMRRFNQHMAERW